MQPEMSLYMSVMHNCILYSMLYSLCSSVSGCHFYNICTNADAYISERVPEDFDLNIHFQKCLSIACSKTPPEN